MENKLEIKIKNIVSNISIIRVIVTSFLTPLELSLDEIMEIKTAVSEAVTNSIEHAYFNEDNIVKIVFKLSKIDNMQFISVVIEDYGKGIEDIELATTPGFTTKPELEHAGMGFTIMETFMDEVIIDSNEKSGTKLTMIKKLSEKMTNIIKENCSNERSINM